MGNDRIAVGHLSYRAGSATHYMLVDRSLKPATGAVLTLCGRTSRYGDGGWWDAGDPVFNPPKCRKCAGQVVITKEAF